MNSELKIQLDRIVSDLAKIEGVAGSLIVDINGDVLSHHLLQDIDIELFGPMANVITGSSKQMMDSSNQGKIERVLVESRNGKALFLHLGNVHFIVLMSNNANVGMVMISSKRASQKIVELTKDLILEAPEEKVVEPVKEATEPVEEILEAVEPVEEILEAVEPVEEIQPVKPEEETAEPAEIASTPVAEEEAVETVPDTPVEEISVPAEKVEPVKEGIAEDSAETVPEEVAVQEPEDVPQKEPEILVEKEAPAEEEEAGISIPVIKPPIAFPKLEKVTEIPGDDAKRIDLLLEIYEYIFLAMSIGASKIMGVAPARGLTRKFLPVDECKILLEGVDVKNNSTIDFSKIRENAAKIPLAEREQIFKESFGKIIEVITENYGKVMGYSAFRAMIRPEFKIINESYGDVLDELGVKEQLHPELRDFFG